jgi:hypothetical protein
VESDGGGVVMSDADQSGEGPAVDRYYRVSFAVERDFRQWTERILEFTAALRDMIPDRPDMRPVIFAPLRPAQGEPLYAYVSTGARGVGIHISGGAVLDPTPVPLAELPRGQTMLFGEPVDAEEYELLHG